MAVRWSLLLGLLLALAAPAMAAAQDEVFIEPDSPSARQYSVPLDEVRRDAGTAGRPERVRPGDRAAPLFGEGIEEDDGATPLAGGTGRTGRDSAASGEAGARGTSQRGRSPLPPLARADRAVLPASGAGDLGPVVALTLAVLLAGVCLGLFARRRRRAT